MKKCNTCRQSKPLAAFYKQAHATDGHKCKCSECEKQAQRDKRLDNPELTRLADRAANRKRREYQRDYQRARRARLKQQTTHKETT